MIANLHYERHVFICTNQKAEGKACCANKGGKPFFDYLKQKLVGLNLHGLGKIRVSQSGCLGRCAEGPCLLIYPDGVWYTYESFEDLDEIVDCVLLRQQSVERLRLDNKIC